jgi:hypothetical protein
MGLTAVILIIFVQKAYDEESRQTSATSMSNMAFVLQEYYNIYDFCIYCKKSYYTKNKY